MSLLQQARELLIEGRQAVSIGNCDYEKAEARQGGLIAFISERSLESEGLSSADFVGFARAELAYIHRQQKNDCEARENLEAALAIVDIPKTAVTRGRIHEEAALVNRFIPISEPLGDTEPEYDYEIALIHAREMVGFYEESVETDQVLENKVLDEAARQKMLLRSYGLLSIALRDVSKSAIFPEAEVVLLGEARLYAEKEAMGRDELGIIDADTTNAYHTLGVVINQRARSLSDPDTRAEHYGEALVALEKAKGYSTDARQVANINECILAAHCGYDPTSIATGVAYRVFLDTVEDLSPADARYYRDTQTLYEDVGAMGMNFLDELKPIIEAKIAKE